MFDTNKQNKTSSLEIGLKGQGTAVKKIKLIQVYINQINHKYNLFPKFDLICLFYLKCMKVTKTSIIRRRYLLSVDA